MNSPNAARTSALGAPTFCPKGRANRLARRVKNPAVFRVQANARTANVRACAPIRMKDDQQWPSAQVRLRVGWDGDLIRACLQQLYICGRSRRRLKRWGRLRRNRPHPATRIVINVSRYFQRMGLQHTRSALKDIAAGPECDTKDQPRLSWTLSVALHFNPSALVVSSGHASGNRTRWIPSPRTPRSWRHGRSVSGASLANHLAQR
jgi:hypothetical protein